MDIDPYKAPEANLESRELTTNIEFYVVSIKKFTVLFFVTLSMYQIYWFYKNWALIKKSRELNIWPVPRSIFAIFFAHKLFAEVQQSLSFKNHSFPWSPDKLALCYIAFSVLSFILDNLSDKNIGSPFTDFASIAIIALVFVPLSKAQKAINFSQNDPKGESNDKFTAINYFWAVLGLAFWGLVVVGILGTSQRFK